MITNHLREEGAGNLSIFYIYWQRILPMQSKFFSWHCHFQRTEATLIQRMYFLKNAVHLSQWLTLSPLSLALSLPKCFSLKKSTLIFTNTPTYLVNLISNPTFNIVFDPFLMGHKTSSNKPEKCMMTCVPVFQVTKFALGLQIKENLGQIKEPGKSPLQFITARFIIKSRLLFQRD